MVTVLRLPYLIVLVNTPSHSDGCFEIAVINTLSSDCVEIAVLDRAS